jgi:lysyl endopeptidase
MRIVNRRSFLATVAAFGAAAMAGLSGIGDAYAAAQVTAVPPAVYRPANAVQKSASEGLAANAASRRIVLSKPTDKELAVLKAKNTAPASRRNARVDPKKGSAVAIGFPRAIPAASKAIVLASLDWQTLEDGSRVARVDVHSPGAAGLRLSLGLASAHPDLTVRFAGNAARAEVFGPRPLDAIAQSTARDGVFWTPVLEGDTASIEVHAATGSSVEGVTLHFGPLAHMVLAGEALRRADDKRAVDIGASAACNIDIACVTPSVALTQAANSVGKIVYNDRAGFTYACSGTMLNDSTRTFTPYFFSANHCIADDPAFMASTINVYWFFRAQNCNSTAVPPFALQTGGAMLLARSDDWDWLLLRLNTQPPVGVTFSAWRAEPVPEGAVATGLHHPAGDLAKFSQGSSTGYQIFSDGTTFIRMVWSQGTTEVGSSGSGLFTYLAAGDFYEVRGSLFGGEASCAFRDGNDYYSRLDNMLPLTRQYLTPDAPNTTSQTVVVEFYNAGLDHYFITSDANEINLLDTGVLRGWVRTGVRFLAYSAQVPGTNPVCRFYLRPEVGDSHFYSGDPNECAQTLARFGASWIYEGPSVFYIALPNFATGACPADTTPVWRFFNGVTTNHRYTTELFIRETLRADPRWVAEGYGPDAVIMCAATT